jgi:hypothetical protein
MLVILSAASVFLCADHPDRPLFIVDYDKCTHVVLSTITTPNPRRPALREVTLRIEAAVPRSRSRYRLSDVRVRVNCTDLTLQGLSSTDFNSAGRVVGRQQFKTPKAFPKITDPLQLKALRAACRSR